mmetsp:Transcript_2467/g.4192  ORF Transcript_2467/g.4192 Transcript_2467/m.4192 type:complete len:467 (+) Transcript_2467:1365-2765(+)
MLADWSPFLDVSDATMYDGSPAWRAVSWLKLRLPGQRMMSAEGRSRPRASQSGRPSKMLLPPSSLSLPSSSWPFVSSPSPSPRSRSRTVPCPLRCLWASPISMAFPSASASLPLMPLPVLPPPVLALPTKPRSPPPARCPCRPSTSSLHSPAFSNSSSTVRGRSFMDIVNGWTAHPSKLRCCATTPSIRPYAHIISAPLYKVRRVMSRWTHRSPPSAVVEDTVPMADRMASRRMRRRRNPDRRGGVVAVWSRHTTKGAGVPPPPPPLLLPVVPPPRAASRLRIHSKSVASSHMSWARANNIDGSIPPAIAATSAVRSYSALVSVWRSVSHSVMRRGRHLASSEVGMVVVVEVVEDCRSRFRFIRRDGGSEGSKLRRARRCSSVRYSCVCGCMYSCGYVPAADGAVLSLPAVGGCVSAAALAAAAEAGREDDESRSSYAAPAVVGTACTIDDERSDPPDAAAAAAAA